MFSSYPLSLFHSRIAALPFIGKREKPLGVEPLAGFII